MEHLLAQAKVLITPDRRGKGFAEPVEIGSHARPFNQLVAFTGREP